MAAFDLEEQEQISQIKGWWEQYGKIVTIATVLAAVSSVGWQGWTWYQRKQNAEASVVYAAIQKAAVEHKPQQAREAAGVLIEKYSGSSYADIGTLLAAKVQVDAGDLKNARTQLTWVADKASDEPTAACDHCGGDRPCRSPRPPWRGAGAGGPAEAGAPGRGWRRPQGDRR